jgi:hypothetical protein
MMTQKKYHLFADNSKSGPFDAKEVLDLFAKRGGSAPLHLWSAEIGEWSPIEQHLPMLRAEAADTGPAAPPVAGPTTVPGNGRTTQPKAAGAGKAKLAVIAVVVVAALAGAFVFWQKNSPQSVQGKILIVQKNAEVRKLALVKVDILEKEQKLRWAAVSKAKLNAHLDDSSRSVNQLKAKAKETLQDIPEMTLRYESLSQSLFNIGANALLLNINRSNRTSALGPKETEWMNEMTDHVKKAKFLLPLDIDEMVANREFFKIYLAARYDGFRNLESHSKNDGPGKSLALRELADDAKNLGESFTETARVIMYSVPQDILRAGTETTDGDGQFTVKLAPGEYTFIASSSRQVANSEEKYYWALDFTVTSSGDNKIMLGNQNLESGDPRSHWHSDATASVERLRGEISAIMRAATEQAKSYKSPAKIIEEGQKRLQELKDS